MYKLAIIGATGLVGRTVLKILEEKNLPIYEYVLFSSKKSAGSIIHFNIWSNYNCRFFITGWGSTRLRFKIFQHW